MTTIFNALGGVVKECRQYLDSQLKDCGLTRYELLVIALVMEQQAQYMSQSELRDYLGIDDSYLTKVLDKLIKNIWWRKLKTLMMAVVA